MSKRNTEFPCLPNYTGPKSGLFFCVHHQDPVFEWSDDIRERVKAYDCGEKVAAELPLRRSHLLYLPRTKFKKLYADYRKAYADWQKAEADWQKAEADWQKAYADWQKAQADWQKAEADWQKAYADWQKAYADWQKAEADYRKAYADWQKAEADKVIAYAKTRIKNFSYERGKGLLWTSERTKA